MSQPSVETQAEGQLWSRLRNGGDPQARLQLIELHAPLAKRIAAQLYAGRRNDGVEFSDYLQYAHVGLIEAVDRYVPDGEAAFSTFATYRIRGAVLNGIVHETEQREQSAYRSRLRQDRINSLVEGGGPGIFEELVDVAIGLALGYMLEDSGMVRDEGAVSAESPYAAAEYAQMCECLADAVENLPERERMIIRYHYFHHVGFEALANLLGVTKGRISQLHRRALEAIRSALQEKLDHWL